MAPPTATDALAFSRAVLCGPRLDPAPAQETLTERGSGGSRLGLPPVAHPVIRALWGAMRLRGLTVAQLAERAKIHERTLEAWRGGKTSPTLDTLDQALAALDLKLTVLGHRMKL